MKTVLIVEDTADFAENLKFSLVHAGFNVVVTSSGKEGVEQALRIKPDLIFMDILMPDLDGIETTLLIKEQETLKYIPIIFLTSVTAGENVITSVQGKDYLTISKLIDHEKLLNKVSEFLKD